jgi:hypothetical protein
MPYFVLGFSFVFDCIYLLAKHFLHFNAITPSVSSKEGIIDAKGATIGESVKITSCKSHPLPKGRGCLRREEPRKKKKMEYMFCQKKSSAKVSTKAFIEKSFFRLHC